LVLGIDQMEELFTTEKKPASREALVRLLATLAGSHKVCNQDPRRFSPGLFFENPHGRLWMDAPPYTRP
jgi:hypothetical protein